MEKLTIIINGSEQAVEYPNIKQINNGKALTNTGRWYDIVCDCLSINDYETIPDSEAPGGNGYIICERCNRIHYLKDLKDMQEDI